MTDPCVGLAGLGLLGTAIAERLLAAGWKVVGYDPAADGRDRLAALGGQPVDSLAELARVAESFYFALPDSRVVANVVQACESHWRPETLVLDATTGDPADSRTRAVELAALGVRYLDATVVGSSEQVRRGAAIMLVGGDSPAIAAAHDLLAACAPNYFAVGPAGSGATLKLVVNLVLGLERAALAEGLRLAESCGFDLAQTLAILQASPASSQVMTTKGPKMVVGDFTPQARLAQHHKDVQLILELGRRTGITLPLSTAHELLLQTAIQQGLGPLDNSAVFQSLRQTDAATPPHAP